jgi:hypothetical protein
MDMQAMRMKLLRDLEDVFNMSKAFAQSKEKDEAGEQLVSAKQRQIWIRIMAYTGQVMNSISKSFDEAQVAKDLERLEGMLNEAMATEKGGAANTPN